MDLSIIAEGGGMRGAYVFGCMDALFSHYGLKRVDYLTGSSAGIGTLACYMAGQMGEGFQVWMEDITDQKMMSTKNLLKGKYLDLDYFIDDVLRKKLNLEKLADSETKLIIPVTDTLTGQARYFENDTDVDLYDVMKASMSLPFVFGNVKLEDRLYFDGAFSDPLPVDYPGIEGSKKIIILTKDEDYKEDEMFTTFLTKMTKPLIKPGVYKQLQMMDDLYDLRLQQVNELEKQGDIVIKPSKEFNNFDNGVDHIRDAIICGYEDTISNVKVGKFIKRLRKSPRSDFYFNAPPQGLYAKMKAKFSRKKR